MKKIILGLSLVISLFASIESEVENSRFSHKNRVLTDTFSNMQWQDTFDDIKWMKGLFKNWKDSKEYYSGLIDD